MRRILFLMALGVAACGGDDNGLTTTPEQTQHVPEISNLQLSPDSALYLERGGTVPITAELAFTDLAADIETLRIELSDGTSLAIDIADRVETKSGMLSEVIEVATVEAGGSTVEAWVVDKAGQSSNHLSTQFNVIPHVPEISELNVSSDGALYMDGDGSVVVTAEMSFKDVGQDMHTLRVRMPDGTISEFVNLITAETGVLTEDLTVSTERPGEFTLEFWLVDIAGQSSNHLSAPFQVRVENVHTGDWIKRLGELPYVLHDVIWDGNVFIAVGSGGAILTSVDGINWVTRESGTTAELSAVAAYGPDIYAVGGFVVLVSTDHGETWSVKASSDFLVQAVAVNASQIVVTGVLPYGYWGLLPKIMISEDRGATWQTSDFELATDLVYRDGLFVATTRSSVLVSSDGKQWNEITLREWDFPSSLRVVVHDDTQCFVAGDAGTVFSSFDAVNWTATPSLFDDVSYGSGASNGSLLVLAAAFNFHDSPDGTWRPIGISSNDGGASWGIFDIESDYTSNGIAWGSGRFVSVGRISLPPGGAIYTTE